MVNANGKHEHGSPNKNLNGVLPSFGSRTYVKDIRQVVGHTPNV
jgi:hypothetical protein